MQYPWTETGLTLLSAIQAYVEEQGGRERLLEAVLLEMDSGFDTCPESFRKQEEQILSLYGKVRRQEISEQLGLTPCKVQQVIASNHRKGLPKLGKIKKDGPRLKKLTKPQIKISKRSYEYKD